MLLLLLLLPDDWPELQKGFNTMLKTFLTLQRVAKQKM